MTRDRQRLYAALLVLGACVLLGRAAAMMAQGLLMVLVPWVSVLLVLELALDLVWLVGSIRWWLTREEEHGRMARRSAAAAILLHGARVLVFVLGRTGPWIDFDVRPEHRALHPGSASWFGVYFAAVMAALGVLGVVLVWRHGRRSLRSGTGPGPAEAA